MKIGIWVALAAGIGSSLAAQAIPYRYSISSPDGTKLSQAKNCVDYAACTRPALSLNPPAGRSHVRLDLPGDHEAKNLLRSCDFRRQETLVTLMKEKNGKFARSTDRDVAPVADRFASLPNLYLPALSPAEQAALAATLNSFVRAGRLLDAIRHAVRTLRMNTLGYRFAVDPKLVWIAVTTHDDRLIRLAPQHFSDPCQLIKVIRHELEHATQMERVRQCEAVGLPNSLSEHLERERSAYLNDIANARRYCGDAGTVRRIVDNAWYQMRDRYLRH